MLGTSFVCKVEKLYPSLSLRLKKALDPSACKLNSRDVVLADSLCGCRIRQKRVQTSFGKYPFPGKNVETSKIILEKDLQEQFGMYLVEA
jgi:hypothetical protein